VAGDGSFAPGKSTLSETKTRRRLGDMVLVVDNGWRLREKQIKIASEPRSALRVISRDSTSKQQNRNKKPSLHSPIRIAGF
jgi:hypothetical protein